MLYSILKVYVRIALRLFCYAIKVNKPEALRLKGPLLIASNHPNSFLDAIIYDILFDVPIWSLARGDVFRNTWAVPILHNLKIFPVYRTREGVENLADNYKTFDACIEVFKNNGAVTIFSEGLCVNEWHLRTLKKGTARLAFKAWNAGIDLQVLPAGINYSSFRRYGKKIDVHFGAVLNAKDFNLNDSDGNKYTAFNKQLTTALQPLVYEIPLGDKRTWDKKFSIHPNRAVEMLLGLPALLAVVLHAPLYAAAKWVTKKTVNNNDHYDSIMLFFLLLHYPLYWLLLPLLIGFFTKAVVGWVLLLILPLTAWAYVHRKVRSDVAFKSS